MSYWNSKSKKDVSEILENFLSEKPKKKVFGNYRIEGNSLLYRASTTASDEKLDRSDFQKFKTEVKNKFRSHDARLVNKETGNEVLLESLTKDSELHDLRLQYRETNLIAHKTTFKGETVFLGNTDKLDLVGRRVSYGNEKRNEEETEIQELMRNGSEEKFINIPLNRFLEHNLETFSVLEIGKPKIINFGGEKRSYGGDVPAKSGYFRDVLFTVESQFYLATFDRREARNSKLDLRIISFGAAEPEKIDSILESFVPEAVKLAERDKKETKRIGDLFLIESAEPMLTPLTDAERIAILASETGYGMDDAVLFRVSGDKKFNEKLAETAIQKVPRPLTFEKNYSAKTAVVVNGLTYVTGEVSCSGKTSLSLKTWFIVANDSLEIEHDENLETDESEAA